MTLFSKGRNKTFKRLFLLNKPVESWESWKLFRGKRKLKGKRKRFNWKMDDMGEEAVVEVEFFQDLLQIKIFTYIPQLVPFDLSPWNFIIGWRYNPNSMCLTILHFLTSQLLTELKNITMTLKQLQKSNASKGSKKMNYHVGWTIKRSL